MKNVKPYEKPSKVNIQHFKTCFTLFIFAVLDPDPNPADHKQCGSGYGFTTLVIF